MVERGRDIFVALTTIPQTVTLPTMEKFWIKMDEDARRERRRRQRQKCISCFKKMAAFLFSHIGLAAMVVAYSIAGGFLFKALEAPYEVREKMRIREWKEDKIEDIWKLMINFTFTVSKRLNKEGLGVLGDLDKQAYTAPIRAILLEFQGEVTKAVKDKGWDGKDATDQADLQWSFAGALLYAVTVITTIGYGHVAPKTVWGRLVTIVYALVGIPLTFLYLSNIGNFLADCFRMFYKKICCDLCCCQKCERKKKRERMRLKKQREWAAQRNSVLKATASARYTDSSIHDNIMIEDMGSGEVIVLPGHNGDLGHDNLTVENDNEDNLRMEEGCLGGCPSPSHNACVERWQDFPDDLRETAILGEDDDAIVSEVDEYGNVIKETAILDSDTDNEMGLKNSGSTNFGPLSNPNRRHSLFTKLDDAKETDILDDSDDEVFINEQIPTTQSPPVTKSLERKSKSSSEGSKKSKSKSNRAVSTANEEGAKPKSALKKGSVKVKKKDRSKSTEKKQEKESTSSGKERDTLSPARAVSVKEKGSTKGKHKPSKKLKRKDTKKKKEKESNKKKKSKVQKSIDSGDETRNIMEDETCGADQNNSDDESFVTARGESASFVGEDGDAINDAYQGDVITQQPEMGIVTIATQDGVVKYDPDSVAIDVGTNSPYEIDHLDFRDMSAAQASALGYVDVDFEEEDEDEKVTVPISICLIIIAGYIFGGSVLFTLWEEWDYLTGSYFCFITLSTIGFGDIVPGTDMKEWASSEKLVLCALWLAFGLSLLAMCFNLMQEEVKEKCKWVGQKLGLLRDEDEG